MGGDRQCPLGEARPQTRERVRQALRQMHALRPGTLRKIRICAYEDHQPPAAGEGGEGWGLRLQLSPSEGAQNDAAAGRQGRDRRRRIGGAVRVSEQPQVGKRGNRLWKLRAAA